MSVSPWYNVSRTFMTLTFDLNIKIIFSPWIWVCQNVFALWHRHTKFWHMGVSSWDNMLCTFLTLVWPWPLTYMYLRVAGGILSEFYSQFLSCFFLLCSLFLCHELHSFFYIQISMIYYRNLFLSNIIYCLFIPKSVFYVPVIKFKIYLQEFFFQTCDQSLNNNEMKTGGPWASPLTWEKPHDYHNVD